MHKKYISCNPRSTFHILKSWENKEKENKKIPGLFIKYFVELSNLGKLTIFVLNVGMNFFKLMKVCIVYLPGKCNFDHHLQSHFFS